VNRSLSRVLRWPVFAGMLVCVAGALHAQETVATAPNTDGRRVDADALLARPVTFQVDHVPLRQAINALAKQINVLIGYQRETLDASGRVVTLTATRQPLGAILAQLLAGTKLHAVVTASEQRQLFHRQALRPWQLVVSRVDW